MSMSEVNKGGRPREEPTNVRSVRLPNRVWKLVQKASKGSRSVNEYIQTLIENDLIKRKMLKKSERKKLSSKTRWTKNGTKGETLTPLRTSLKVTAHERIVEVNKVESDIKAGMKFKFPWLNEAGVTK